MTDTEVVVPAVAQTMPHLAKRRDRPAVVIACGNQKGGVGKSATCASLASAFSREYAVLGIDLDHQGQFGQDLGLVPEQGDPTVGEWLMSDLNTDPHGFIYETDYAVDMTIALADRLSRATTEIRNDDIGGLKRLARRVELVRSEYDFIIIDLPAGLETLTNVGLIATDVVLPIVTPDYAAWLSGNAFITRVEQVRAEPHLNPNLRLGPIVRNAYNATSNPPEQQRTVDASIAESGREVWPGFIARSEYISKARGYMAPAERAFARHQSTMPYRQLAKFLVEWCDGQGI